MKGPLSIKYRLIELRRYEAAAKLEFDEAKNRLIKIKREIAQIESILTVPAQGKFRQ